MNRFSEAFIDFMLFGATFAPFLIGVAILFLIAWKTQDIWGDHFARFLGIEEGAEEEPEATKPLEQKPHPLQRYSA